MAGLISSAIKVDDGYDEGPHEGDVGYKPPKGFSGFIRVFPSKYPLIFGLVKAWIIVGTYMMVGVLMYIYALGEPWTVIDTLYFSVATMSTVGYGDLSPSGPYSRGFTCFYIMFGVTYVFSVIAQAATIGMVAIEDKLALIVRFCQRLAGINPDAVAVDLDGDGDVDYVPPPPAWVFYLKGIGFWVVVLIVLQAAFVGTLSATQPGLPWNEAAYHCFVTMTTVGYGDITLSTQGARLTATIHILVSVTLLATFISKLQALHASRLQELKKAELLSKQLDVDLITSLDTDGDGVNKVEFVVGMLTKLELIKWSDVEPFMSQFDAMDTDGGGLLTADDLAAMVAAKVAKAEAKAECKVADAKAHGMHMPNPMGHLGKLGHHEGATPRSSSPTTVANAARDSPPRSSSPALHQSPLIAKQVGGGKSTHHPPLKKGDVGGAMDQVARLTQQSLDRIRVLEADGQLRREHAKKIEHKLDEHARVQLRLEESLQRIHDLLTAQAGGGGHRASHRSSHGPHRSSSVTSQERAKSTPNSGGLAHLNSGDSIVDGQTPNASPHRNSDGRATTRDDSRGRSVRKRVPITTDSQTGAAKTPEAKAEEQRDPSL